MNRHLHDTSSDVSVSSLDLVLLSIPLLACSDRRHQLILSVAHRSVCVSSSYVRSQTKPGIPMNSVIIRELVIRADVSLLSALSTVPSLWNLAREQLENQHIWYLRVLELCLPLPAWSLWEEGNQKHNWHQIYNILEASVGVGTYFLSTLLTTALEKNECNLVSVKILLERGHNNIYSQLGVLSQHGSLETVKYMIERQRPGADYLIRMLGCAASGDRLDNVKHILSRLQESNLGVEELLSCMFVHALMSKSFRVLEYILQEMETAGIDLNSEHRYSIDEALEGASIEMIALLEEAGTFSIRQDLIVLL